MTPDEFIRVVMALLTERGLSPVLRPADLQAAHGAAHTLLRLMTVLPYTEDHPVFRRVEEGR